MEKLIAETFDSGFAAAHDTYNALSKASNGKIYYILSSDRIDAAGRMFEFDPTTSNIRILGDLSDICGEAGMRVVPQGKSHVDFYEYKNKLYFSTHVGYYQLIDGMDRLPVTPPDGYGKYQGGHIISYDPWSDSFEDLAKLENGEGFVSMTMDTDRGHIYGISWPTGKFVHYDVNANALKLHESISGRGEDGIPGDDFRSLCRSLVVDPTDGTVYMSVSEGDILSFHPENNRIEKLSDVDLRIDYFGKYDPTRPGNMGYNWRKIFWYDQESVAYGVHGNSGYLFKFDPQRKQIELIDRITSSLSKKCGMFDQFSYGYLGFALGNDNETIHYLTGGPIFENGKRVKGDDEIAKGAARGLENLHLITYNIPQEKYTDHGPIFYQSGERPLYVNSIAIGEDGTIYTLARVEREGKTITDLIRISSPF